MKFYLTAVFLFATFLTDAQFSDDFTDGNFTDDPSWTGIVDNFEVNDLNQLHLLAPAVSDTSYLSVASSDIDNVTWDFWVRMDFNPSSSNNARIYLVSNQENLKESLNGYFVMIGNTEDEVSLYRQDGTTITEIIDGTDDVVDVSDVEVRVKVTRDDLGNWEVLRDATGGYAFESEGTVLDDTHNTTSHFGVFCKYTSTRSELFYFDDLGTPYADGTDPNVESAVAISSTEVDVLFSEPLDVVTAELTSNYTISDGIGTPVEAVLDGDNPALVHLTVGSPFSNGASYEVTVSGVEDLGGNPVVEPAVVSFLYFIPETPVANDLIFTEIFPDPNPVIGLPEVEFFEIHNRSDKYFDLAGWTVNDNTNTATFDTYIIEPGEYLVICGEGEAELFATTNVLETGGLPTLTNSADYLVFKTDEGLVLDSVNYAQSWYKDPEKEDGGWTLERKHLNSPCSDQNNWGASVDPSGGTPGLQNSIWTDEDDATAPLVSSFLINSETEVEVVFNEIMDTTVTVDLEIDPAVGLISSEYSELNVLQVAINVLEAGNIYTLTIKNGQDCWGNAIDESIQFGLPLLVEQGDLELNEIMFNPLTGGSDYVELYNVSDKILNLQDVLLANWDDDTIANFKPATEEQRLILPGEYITLTEDSTDIINDFAIYGIGTFVETDLPTYPNDSGTVYVFRSDSVLLDYFHYDEDFHYALLSTEDGKALERISHGGEMNNPDNWHTASENVDWGTPGYLNSQFLTPNALGDVSIDPQLFSPDNDGYKDVLTINFDLADNDNIVDIIIYDNQGRQIRQLKDNYFIGQKGLLTWDGINDDGEKAAIGTYILFISVKNSLGDETVFKLVTVLAGNL